MGVDEDVAVGNDFAGNGRVVILIQAADHRAGILTNVVQRARSADADHGTANHAAGNVDKAVFAFGVNRNAALFVRLFNQDVRLIADLRQHVGIGLQPVERPLKTESVRLFVTGGAGNRQIAVGCGSIDVQIAGIKFDVVADNRVNFAVVPGLQIRAAEAEFGRAAVFAGHVEGFDIAVGADFDGRRLVQPGVAGIVRIIQLIDLGAIGNHRIGLVVKFHQVDRTGNADNAVFLLSGVCVAGTGVGAALDQRGIKRHRVVFQIFFNVGQKRFAFFQHVTGQTVENVEDGSVRPQNRFFGFRSQLKALRSVDGNAGADFRAGSVIVNAVTDRPGKRIFLVLVLTVVLVVRLGRNACAGAVGNHVHNMRTDCNFVAGHRSFGRIGSRLSFAVVVGNFDI